MSIDRFHRYNRGFLRFGDVPPTTQFREISKCVVRKDHPCGKFLGASKSCFVACPSTDEVNIMLDLIIEKLTKIGVEPVIAIKERAYGQDIFCIKICGKIIESQFCLVILDDTIEPTNGSGVNIPNPNVYYEYGLMTALNKHVIPLQKEGQELAFNIQTHDTIKYTPRNLSTELDKAFKDAIKTTQEDRSGYQDVGAISIRLFSRCLEINGYERKDYHWFLSDDFDDTVFTSYGHPERREYLFFTVANDKESLQNALTDMPVIIRRLESRHKELSEKIDALSAEIAQLNQESEGLQEQIEAKAEVAVAVVSLSDIERPAPLKYQLSRISRAISGLIKERDETSSKLELIQNSKFAIILSTEVIKLKEKAIAQYDAIDKKVLSLPLYIGDITGVQIGDLNIPFKAPSL